MTIAAVVLALLIPGVAAAKTYEPTRKDDPVPGTCKPKDCSLREAVIAANDDSNVDTIKLGQGRYRIEIDPVPGEIPSAATGNFDLTSPMKLIGRGAKRTKIDAGGRDAVLRMVDQYSGDTSKLQALKLTGGDPTVVSDPQQSNSGGAIYMYASPTVLNRVVITGNEAVTGGGIRAQSEDLIVKKSTIAGNNAAEGGGIWTGPRVNPPSRTRISSSTVSGNFANKGAGILADGYNSSGTLTPPDLDLFNSTVAGNKAAAEAGGIMADNNATVDLDNTTVAYNTADEDNTGGGVGGGVHQHSGAVFGLGDSVIAANEVGTSGTGAQCAGAFLGDADGLVMQGQSSGTCSYGGIYTNVADALIGPLAKNGGPTKTIKLHGGSPAIGYAESCPPRDQRGALRPNNCDSGGYENKPRR